MTMKRLRKMGYAAEEEEAHQEEESLIQQSSGDISEFTSVEIRPCGRGVRRI